MYLCSVVYVCISELAHRPNDCKIRDTAWKKNHATCNWALMVISGEMKSVQNVICQHCCLFYEKFWNSLEPREGNFEGKIKIPYFVMCMLFLGYNGIPVHFLH